MRILTIVSIALLLTGLFLLPETVLAHQTAPEKECSQPEIPEQFLTQDQVDAFMEKVNTYQECINTYIDAQNKASQVHEDAANSALEEWNTFAAEVNKRNQQ